ncbi:MAG: tetratricopeptide repeat protein, partial [Acidobacteriota bacterium]
MLSKIELYREVLDIEPNSKVFFPLGRQLAEEGRHDEAVAVLTRGIGFHPDHLEAKFLLIEILTRQGREDQAQDIFKDVGAMLSRYPSVWLLWSKNAAARSKDPSLAMLFLAHYFQNQTLTWADVMERGLKSLSEAAGQNPTGGGGDAAIASRTAPDTVSAEPAATPQADAVAGAPQTTAASGQAAPVENAPSVAASGADTVAAGLESTDSAAARPPREPASGPELRGAREVLALADILDAPLEPAERARPRAAKPREQAVRTKTMAAVLAGQGDTAGALDIYGELLATTPAGPEREELLGLMAALTPTPETDAPA